jgi:transcriptional regulator with XRE-family HTH domain
VNTPGKAEKSLRVRLRELRQKAGLTQEAYAEQAKFSYKYYQGIERGQWTNLRLRTLEKLADGYGVALHELFSPKTPVPRVKMSAKKSKSCGSP